MKTIILLLVTILCGTSVYGQFGQQIISTNAEHAVTVIPYDMNNDGFIDVVSASLDDDKIA